MAAAEFELTSTSVTNPRSTSMKALVYHGAGKYAWEDRPRPSIRDPGDAVCASLRRRFAEPIFTS